MEAFVPWPPPATRLPLCADSGLCGSRRGSPRSASIERRQRELVTSTTDVQLLDMRAFKPWLPPAIRIPRYRDPGLCGSRRGSRRSAPTQRQPRELATSNVDVQLLEMEAFVARHAASHQAPTLRGLRTVRIEERVTSVCFNRASTTRTRGIHCSVQLRDIDAFMASPPASGWQPATRLPRCTDLGLCKSWRGSPRSSST